MKPLALPLAIFACAFPGPFAQETAQKPAAQRTTTLPSDWVRSFTWRSIGPANMGGRIVGVAVYEKDPTTYWLATASGGLLKTSNNGITFEHQFDRESTVSLGAVAVAQTDPKIVWVGTGENNPRNSVSYGDGVYKSVDGGKTWQHMGLRQSFQTGDIVIHPENADIVYVGALGRLYGPNEQRGLFKTTDGGKTWSKILYVDDKTGVIDIAMHPRDPDVLLVATYERQRDGFDTNDPAKKIAPGSGLYRTIDGGATFQRITKGLPSCKLGRIGLDWYRKNPQVVFAVVESEMIGKAGPKVGWSGLTTANADAGAKVTTVAKDSPAAAAGVQKDDVVIKVNGETIVSRAEFEERLAQHEIGQEVKLDVVRKGECQEMALTLAKAPPAPVRRAGRRGSADRPFGANLGGQRANAQKLQGKNGHEHGGLYRSDDGGKAWVRINSINPRPMYFSQIRVDPSDQAHLYILGVSGARSKDGGKTFTSDMTRGVHADQHTLWINPKDGRHMILGCDGGAYVTHDRCQHWDHLNHAALGQFYHATFGPRRDYWVYGGLQDNGSWGAPHRSARGSGPVNEHWLRIGGGDGFVCRVDPNDPDQLYYESQNGRMGRTNLRTMEGGRIRPRAPRPPARTAGERPRRERAQGERQARAASGERRGARRRRGERAGQGEQSRGRRGRAARGEGGGAGQRGQPARSQTPARQPTRFRFNWKTPFILSHHNSRIFYCAGNHVFRSLKRGDDLKKISPEITLTDRGSATALAESPKNADVLYVGTDDGALWGTRDGGKTWLDLFQFGDKDVSVLASTEGNDGENGGGPYAKESSGEESGPQPIRKLIPGPRWVGSIEASHFEEGRVYLCLDGHRSDDDEPYVLVSEDYGKSWQSLRANLPWGSTRVVREDRQNPNLLYCGTEFGIWASVNRGRDWTRINNNLPTVAVHEVAQHATSGEIMAATHGRSLWLLDVTALRQVTPQTIGAAAHLYRPNSVIRWVRRHSHGVTGGARRFTGANPPSQAHIFYTLGKNADSVKLTVRDAAGKVLRTLETETAAGLHRVAWDLRREATAADRAEQERRMRERFGPEFERFRRFIRRRNTAPAVANGTYTVVLEVDGKTFRQPVEILPDPNFPHLSPGTGRFGEEEEEAELDRR